MDILTRWVRVAHAQTWTNIKKFLQTWGREYGLTHELPEVQMNFMSTHNVPVPKFK